MQPKKGNYIQPMWRGKQTVKYGINQGAPKKLTNDEKALLAREKDPIDCDDFDFDKVGEKIDERLRAINKEN